VAFPPYKQYTTCVDAASFDKSSRWTQAAVIAAGVVAPLAVIGLMVNPLCLLLLVPVGAAAGVIGYCYWFLYKRLICLPPQMSTLACSSDQMAIGMVIDTLPPYGNSGFDALDTDYSFGLLVAPNHPDDSQSTVWTSMPYGFLVSEQPATLGIGLPTPGNQATYKVTGQPDVDGVETLHCEFEGAGVHDLLLASSISLALAIAAFFVCLFVPFPFAALAWLLAFLAFVVLAIGFNVAANDNASPSDENPALGGDLHPGDILVVAGSWVYDSGHSGFNEIHPIKFCSPIGNVSGEWPSNLASLENYWPTALCDATSTTTIELQKQPQNQWQVHPILDGCDPVVIV
jgi:hypothetical protein